MCIRDRYLLYQIRGQKIQVSCKLPRIKGVWLNVLFCINCIMVSNCRILEVPPPSEADSQWLVWLVYKETASINFAMVVFQAVLL